MKSKIEQLVLGMVSTNTWFLMNTESKEMVLLDPADEAERIEQKIAQMEGIPKAVLLTHGQRLCSKGTVFLCMLCGKKKHFWRTRG